MHALAYSPIDFPRSGRRRRPGGHAANGAQLLPLRQPVQQLPMTAGVSVRVSNSLLYPVLGAIAGGLLFGLPGALLGGIGGYLLLRH